MTDHEYQLRVKQFQGAQFASTSTTPFGQGAMRFGRTGETTERRWVTVSEDGTSFTLLHVGLTDLVEKLRLASIDVAENTADG